MGISWSTMRKKLETENLCDSLRGRITYFATRYRKSHDEMKNGTEFKAVQAFHSVPFCRPLHAARYDMHGHMLLRFNSSVRYAWLAA